MKIIVNRSAASFKGIEHKLMAVLEIVPIELKFVHRSTSRMAIPTIRQNYATVIPKQSFDFRHVSSGHIPEPQTRGTLERFHYLRSASIVEAKFLQWNSTARSRLPYD